MLGISIELVNQLHIYAEEDNYLLKRATERYFVELNNHLHQILDIPSAWGYKNKIGEDRYIEILKIRNSYEESITLLKKGWIEKELRIINSSIKKYDSIKL